MIYSEDHNTNPLTEIGLALSMCFFTIFILISVMKTGVDQRSEPHTLTIESQSSEKASSQNMAEILVFRDGELYDENGKVIVPNEITASQVIIALDASTQIGSALAIERKLPNSIVKFANVTKSRSTQ